MDTDDDVSEDKLLEMPEQALPGGLSRLWAIRSGLLYERQAEELNRELAGDAPPRMLMPWTDPREIRRVEEKRHREQREYEQAMREISERQDRLLLRIEEEQARIDERRHEIDDNALRLHDCRRVYVDGERYRDGEGRVLSGADEAEAARQHEYRPDASTWAQKQDIERRAEDAKRLKAKILQDRESGQGTPEEAGMRLSGYEQEYHDKIEARAQQAPADFGSADYMADYALSAVPAFTAAAAPVSRETIGKLTDDDSGTQTAEIKQDLVPVAGEGENKKPPRSPAQGPQKFQA
jgi:hypothetical protein